MEETIGLILKIKRKEKGLTQVEFARISGVSRSYIVEIEKDVYTNISMLIICDFCRALKCTPNELIPNHYYK
ncbi:MAG: helix-turn-helix transcriptional regulator [Clostridium sp.]|uniref:helix-turn-helix transcriptional regulator n=1 Tax=Clostridium sp. TaxID=1506 RepID=UPI003F2A6AC8